MSKFKWFYITRTIGAIMILYELLGWGGSTERGTIILAGCGLLGFDYVARNEGRKRDVDEDD
jgi:hypothetical protein